MKAFARLTFVLMIGTMVACGTAQQSAETTEPVEVSPPPQVDVPAFELPRGLEEMEIMAPESNALTAAKIKLGWSLFFDKRMSKNDDMSCETCHVPEKGWTDGQRFSTKWNGNVNTRNSPTMYGVAFYPQLYWDGRSKGLEKQIPAAWKGHMGAVPEEIAGKLAAIPGYEKAFEGAFGGPPNGDTIVQALASFVRTIHAGDTAWDRMSAEEQTSGTTEVSKGFKVFSEVAQCTLCHLPPSFSDAGFHNVGVGYGGDGDPDAGRGKALKAAAEKAGVAVPPEAESLMGAFKTPSLRGVALTGPYFHDGSVETLEEAVDYMVNGFHDNPNLPNLDEKLQAHSITAKQKAQLIAFLKALSPDESGYQRPELP